MNPLACFHCRLQCLGAYVLPCGHLVCRKCARSIEENIDRPPFCRWGCHVIRKNLELTRDLVLEEVLIGQLPKQNDETCHKCSYKHAVHICLDCGQLFCAVCSKSHVKGQGHSVKELLKNPRISRTAGGFLTSILRRTNFVKTTEAFGKKQENNSQKYAKVIENQIVKLKRAITQLEDVIRKQEEFKKECIRNAGLLEIYISRLSTEKVYVGSLQDFYSRLDRLCETCSPPEATLLDKLNQATLELQAHRQEASRSEDEQSALNPEGHINKGLLDDGQRSDNSEGHINNGLLVDGQDNSESYINNSLFVDGQRASVCEVLTDLLEDGQMRDTREDQINTNPSENGQITDTCESHITTDVSDDGETADPHESQVSIGEVEGVSAVTNHPFNNQICSELPQDGQKANTCEMHSIKSVSILPYDNQVSSETSEETYVKSSQVTTSGTPDDVAIQTTSSSQVTTSGTPDDVAIQTTSSSQVNIGVADEVLVTEELIEINIRPRSEIHQAGEIRPLEAETSRKELNIGHAQRVKVASRITTINMQQEQVQMRTITDRKILDADKNIFLATLHWGIASRVAVLERDVRVLGNENRKLNVLLDEKLAQGEAVKQAIEQKFQDEIKEEQMKVMTFVLKLEQREGLLSGFLRQVESGHFAVVVPRLLRDFNVRLLGVDCGLNFLMEAPVTQWAEVVERQLDMQAMLVDLLPDHLRPEVTWSNAVPIEQDVDLRLGHPSPLHNVRMSEPRSVLDTEPCTEQKFQADEGSNENLRPRSMTVLGGAVDWRKTDLTGWAQNLPTNTSACSTLLVSPNESDIVSLLNTQEGLIVMADAKHKMLLVLCATHPPTFNRLPLPVTPYRLAQFKNGLIVVTADKKSILLVSVAGDLVVVSHVHTTIQYIGVAVGNEQEVIVSCLPANGKPAGIHVIALDGSVVRTITTSSLVKNMSCPHYLCVVGGDVLVSDRNNDSLFQINLSTGALVGTYKHKGLENPCEIAVDQARNFYVASCGGQSVMAKSPTGRWSQYTLESDHDVLLQYPVGVCVRDRVLFVSWKVRRCGTKQETILAKYALTPKNTVTDLT